MGATAQRAAGQRMSRGLTVLFAVAGGVAVGNMYWAQPLLADIGDALGVSERAAGLLVTLTQVGYALGIFLVVPLGDSVNRRRLIPAVMTVSALALAASAAAPSFGVLLAALAFLGFTTVSGQLLTPLAGDLASDEQRGAVVGTVASGLLTGILLSRTISGALADLWGWRAVYVAAAVLTLVMALVLAVALPPVPARPGLPYRALLASVFTVVREHRSVQVTLVLGGIGFCVFTMFWTALTFLLTGAPFGFSLSQVGLVGLAGLAGALAARGVGLLHDRGRSVPATGAALALALVSLGVAAAGQRHLAWVLVAVVFLDAAVQAAQLLHQTRLFMVAPEARSRLNTAFVTSNFIGGGIGSALAGTLWQAGGWRTVMLGAAVLIALALLVWATQRRHLAAVSGEGAPTSR